MRFNGLIPRNPFAQFHISPNVKEREYLTENELKALMTHEFGNAKLSYIRDIFVFANFTVLSFVNLKELTNNNIVEVSCEKWILSKRHKTKVPFQVKLLDIPLQIIERYRPCLEDNLVFPNLNYWSICKPPKKVMKECGITKTSRFTQDGIVEQDREMVSANQGYASRKVMPCRRVQQRTDCDLAYR